MFKKKTTSYSHNGLCKLMLPFTNLKGYFSFFFTVWSYKELIVSADSESDADHWLQK